jgi:hypothetical protein
LKLMQGCILFPCLCMLVLLTLGHCLAQCCWSYNFGGAW